MDQLTELTIRVFTDKCPDDNFQSITIFANTIDNYKIVIEKASELYSHNRKPVIINGAGAISGYVGLREYKKLLIKHGIQEENILVAEPVDPKMLHTRNESVSYIQTLQKNKISNTCLISAPFHQLRAFMTMVTIAIEQKVDIKLYNCTINKYNWNKTITHSQGVLRKKAKELIYEEFNRIYKYQEKGDLATLEIVLEYLNSRD